MTFAQLKTELFRRLRETPSALVWVTEDEAEVALNDGLMELSDATEWHEVVWPIDLLERRPYYDLRTVYGDTVLSVGPAFNEQTNRWLRPTTTRMLDVIDERWERRIGIPEALLTRGLWWLGYWPRSGSDTGTIKQYLATLPDALVADADEPGFPQEFHRGIVDYAVADLLAQDGETALALQAWAAYVTMETGLGAWVEGRLTVPRVRGYV